MATFFQIKSKLRKKKIHKRRNKALEKCPQKRGLCRLVLIMSPRKPNSAKRKVVKVFLLSTKKAVFAYIPGERHNLQKFSNVLIRGGLIRDLPGVHYTVIRGVLDLLCVVNRRTSRSKYGRKNI